MTAKKDNDFYKLLWPYFRPHIVSIIIYFIGLTVQTANLLIMPLGFKLIFDRAIPANDFHMIQLIAIAIMLGVVFQNIAYIISEYLLARITSIVIKNIRLDLFNHIKKMSYEFFQNNPSSNIISLFSEQINSIEQLLIGAISVTFISLLVCTGSIIIMYCTSWKIATLISILFIISIIIPYQTDKSAKKYLANYAEKKNVFLSAIHEYYATNFIIKVFSLQKIWDEKISISLKGTQALELKSNLFTKITPRSVVVSATLSQIIVVVIGSIQILNHTMTVGNAICLLTYSGFFLSAISILLFSLPLLSKAYVAMSRIQKIMQIQPQISEKPDAIILPEINKGIELQNISLNADNQKVILDDISLNIVLGKSIGFVGPSGVGKSTLLRLLLRICDPSKGSIVIDEKYLLKDIKLDSYLGQLAMVAQETLLFNNSIRENILVGRLEASEEDIIIAAKQAGFYDDILLMPNGLDTMVGEQGNRLSGGQRQRLALARALLRKPKILLLDEITASVDALTESEIIRNLMDYSRTSTIITCNHRLNVSIQMDCIYVLNQGRIVESGSHNTLLQKNGYYAKLWKKQNSVVLNIDQTIKYIDLDYLRSIPIFEFCDHELLTKLIHQFKIEAYDENEVIFHQNSIGDKFYILSRGRVEVLIKSKDVQSPKIIATLDEGDFFGEIALITSELRNATIRTKEASVLLTLDTNQFNAILRDSPTVKAKTEEAVANRKNSSSK